MVHENPDQCRALDLLIVPSPIANEPGDAFLEVDPVTGLYLGGHVRLLATVEFSHRYKPHSIVVVGGFHPKHGSRMTRAMKRFIVERNNRADVQRINSLPCTRHNVVALFNQLGRQLEVKRVAVLTNEYHLPRFLAFWSHLQKEYGWSITEPLAIAAESIWQSTLTETLTAALERRRKAEDRGLADLRAGNYSDRCLGQLASFGDELAKHPERYLSPDERAA